MQIFVKDIAGKTLTLSACPEEDVSSLKQQITGVQGIPAEEQRLSYGGRPLSDNDILGECGVTDDATVFMSMNLLGGAKKRKKKTYTKPKKIKHKRKKVKLAVLKFYKVDANEKVQRLRKECPHELCGPGVFMAMHFNRYYCGKCGLTYVIKKGGEED